MATITSRSPIYNGGDIVGYTVHYSDGSTATQNAAGGSTGASTPAPAPTPAPVTYAPSPIPTPSASTSTASFPTTALKPGDTGANVQSLQNFLVANGYMTQAQVNTGYGTYGNQTTAAVLQLQKDLGIDYSSGPGYFGPKTIAGVTSVVAPKSPTGGGTASATAIGSNLAPTGNPSLDAALASISGIANGLVDKGYTIPPNLAITPDLVSQFLAKAHEMVDPNTKQMLDSEILNINADLKNQQLQFDNSKAGLAQTFGSDLATEQNNAGNSGTAFSGMRNLSELNMVNSANRGLSTLASDAAYKAGAALRAGAANVGSENTGSFAAPSITGGTFGLGGGSRGSFNSGGAVDLGYDPSVYKAGIIPSTGNVNVQNQEKAYEDKYQNLASLSSASTRSVSDLLGQTFGGSQPTSPTSSISSPSITTPTSVSTTPASPSPATPASSGSDPYQIGQVYTSNKVTGDPSITGTAVYKGNGLWSMSDTRHGDWGSTIPTSQVQSWGLT